jgi:transposase
VREVYRCPHCGNRTRFDIYETVRRRRFAHYTLGGDVEIDEEEILESTTERVVCRWCDRSDDIERTAPDGR